MPWGFLIVLAIVVVGIVLAATDPKQRGEREAPASEEPRTAPEPPGAAPEDDWPEPGSGSTG